MTSTIETTTDRLAVGDIVAVVDTDGDHLWAVENSIGVVVEVDPGPKTAYDLIGVRQGNGNITKMYAFRLRKLVPGDRVRVSYSESCDGQAVVTGVWSDHLDHPRQDGDGKLAGVTGGFFPKDLFFIEAAPRASSRSRMARIATTARTSTASPWATRRSLLEPRPRPPSARP